MKQLHVNWSTTSNPRVLNLDSRFKPLGLNDMYKELEFQTLEFKGGEPHIKITTKLQHTDKLIITQRYNSIKDLFMIILAVDAAKRVGFKDIQLILPYFPAARQDRVCDEGEPLTIKVFADMINSCGFSNVFIFSPHSEVTPALINNCVEIDYDNKFVSEIINDFKNESVFNIVCPDAGAGKRVSKITKYLVDTYPQKLFNLIRCEKVRDVRDGSLKEFIVQAEHLGGSTSIILDDINSMGGTFIGLSKVLQDKNCGKIVLYTSHSDCISGIENVCSVFDKVYTTNSKQNWNDYNFPYVNVLKCFNINL